MRILLLDVNYKLSSTGKIVYILKEELEKKHDVYVLYGRGSKSKEKNVTKFSYNWETSIHALLTRITGLTGYFSYFSTRRLLRKVKKIRPDVIHIHEVHGYFMNWVTLVKYAIKRNIKIIWTFHADFMLTGRCGMSNDCERWKIGCGKCPNLKTYPKTLFFDFSKQMLKQKQYYLPRIKELTITAPTTWLKDKIKESYLREKRVEVVSNGVDTTIFKPRHVDRNELFGNINYSKMLLLVAPNPFTEQKGGKYALKLASDLKDKDTFVVIVGTNVSEITAKDNLILLPKITDQVLLSKFYSAADFTLMLSKKETFSLVTAESLSCGTPVIGFDAGGPTEIAINNFGQFTVYGEYEKLKKLVCDSIEGKILYGDIDSLRNHIIDNYSKKSMVEKYELLYKEINYNKSS